MDHGTTLTVVQAGFGFGDLVMQAGILAVAALWFCVPFSVFGVRTRLDGIADAQRDHTEALTAELRRFRTLSAKLPQVPAASPRADAPQPVLRTDSAA